MKNIKIKNKLIGDNAPVVIIAEVASAHGGNFDELIKLIDFAKATGADAIKFQVLTAESHMTPMHEIWELVKQLEFSKEQWQEAADYTRRTTELIVITDIYDIESIDKVRLIDPDFIKIHSADLNNFFLVKEAAKLNKPTLIGVGASTIEEIAKCLNVFHSINSSCFVSLMHGYQGFPTELSDMNMNQIKMLRNLFQIPVGFLDHTEGDTEESIYLSLVARALNAFAIEKHIVLDRTLKGIDYEAAVSMEYFKKLVQQIRIVETALGSYQPLPLSKGEKRYRDFMKKNIVASVDIKEGDIIEMHKIYFKRSKGALPQESLENILGKKAKRNIHKNQNINWDVLS